jgi:hypothetical protein
MRLLQSSQPLTERVCERIIITGVDQVGDGLDCSQHLLEMRLGIRRAVSRSMKAAAWWWTRSQILLQQKPVIGKWDCGIDCETHDHYIRIHNSPKSP